MSSQISEITKEDRREINEFLPYLLSYSVDSLKHHQRNIEVQIDELNKNLDINFDRTFDFKDLVPKIFSQSSSSMPAKTIK